MRIRAVIIPFFAGFGIGIGTIECQKTPQFRIRIRIQHYITAGFGIGIGIKECQKTPQFRIRIRIQHRNYNSSSCGGGQAAREIALFEKSANHARK